MLLKRHNRDIIVVKGGDKMDMGEKIKTLREQRGMTLEELGNKVGVGSGFSKQERIHYAEHPEDIVGHIITVKYFEETTNQKGGASMRFPTVKCVYENSGRLV